MPHFHSVRGTIQALHPEATTHAGGNVFDKRRTVRFSIMLNFLLYSIVSLPFGLDRAIMKLNV